jgi:exosortase A-associated hydrolase 1
MNIDQRAMRFSCGGSSLFGVVDVPERPLQRGLLLLADGPQYRIGSHRQFTLLSRALAVRGIPVMRFDRRGMGDSEGEPRACDAVEDDVRAALKEFFIHLPEMKEVVILGLGDAAAAAVLYAHQDERVRGLVLLNPQLRKAQRAPHEALGHHYLARLGVVAFWNKTNTAMVDFSAKLAGFSGQVLVVLGGADPDAHDIARLLARQRIKCKRVDIPAADHAFASREWRDTVATVSANWIVSW